MARRKVSERVEVRGSESDESVDVSSDEEGKTPDDPELESQREVARLYIPEKSVFSYWKHYDEAGYWGIRRGLGVYLMERELANIFKMPDEDFSKYKHVSPVGCKKPYIVKYEE